VAVNDMPRVGEISVDLDVPDRALAVGAHPDDIEHGCGATLAKWSAAGCRVQFLVLTDGSKGTWDPDRDQASLVATRQVEQREAAACLGSDDVGFLGWPDGELRNGVREQWELSRWIRSVRPDVVLGHDPWRRYRLHPDHRNAGFLLVDSIVAARDPLFFVDQSLPPHRPRALLLWEADVPNHVESVEGLADVKIRALLAHRSQFETTFGIPDGPLPAAGNGAGDGPAGSVGSGSPRGGAGGPGGEGDGSRSGGEDGEGGDDGARGRATAAFRSRVRAQLQEQGALAGVELGECFHLIDDI
jgi:LmbE family N-acetylglucosaminyl deacetylase